jgi:flagellar basal body-associated protein FliL
MDDEPSQKPSKGYGKHSKKFWIVVYLVVAVVVYGLTYLLFIHKGGNSGGGFHY